MQRLFVCLLMAWVMGLSCPSLSRAVKIESVTLPKADVFLGFVTGGLVGKVLIKEGDMVGKNKTLASLNDSVERLELARLTALADDRTRLWAAEADLSQKRSDLKKLELAKQQGAATDMELEHATLAVTTAELQVRMEEFQRLQQKQNRDVLQAKIDRMKIVSPINGKVEQIKIETGESVEALAPVIRVVQIDPLWIDVPVPLASVRGVKVGEEVSVFFPDLPDQAVAGKIIHVASVADAASDTFRIRVEVPNPSRRMAGERVLVEVASP